MFRCNKRLVVIDLCAMLFCRYGYLTNTKVKFILVTTDLDVRDADVRNVSMAYGMVLS